MFVFFEWSAASEPNLLKIRLKQSVIERKARAGPLAARRQERLLAAQRRLKQHQSSLIGQSTYRFPNKRKTIVLSMINLSIRTNQLPICQD